MISEEFLFSLAEISIALIGFSGVVTVLGHRGKGEWKADELLQLRTQVEPSAVSLFGAMLPSTLGLVIVELDVLWRVCNGLLAILIGIALGAFLLRARHAPLVASQNVLTIVAIIVFIGLVCSTLNLVSDHQFTFVVGLILGIVVGVHNFALLLFRVEEAA